MMAAGTQDSSISYALGQPGPSTVAGQNDTMMLTQGDAAPNNLMIDDGEGDEYAPPLVTTANSLPTANAIRTKRYRDSAHHRRYDGTKPVFRTHDTNMLDEANSLPGAVDLEVEAAMNEMRDDFLQHWPELEGSEDMNLWRPPMPSRELDIENARATLGQPKADFYDECCKALRDAWGEDAEVCVPEALRGSTPFSMALLLKLGELAKTSRGTY